MAARRRRNIRGPGRCRRAVPEASSARTRGARVNPTPAGPASDPSGGGRVSGKVTGWAVHHGPADRLNLLVLIVIADAARNDGTGVRLGMREIARRSRSSLGAVSGAVADLVSGGWIEQVSVGAGGVPSEYRVVVPQAVDDAEVVHPTERGRSLQSERGRSVQSERGRSLQSERPYIDTGFTGLTGAPRSAPGRRRRRRSTADEQAVVDACPDCDERGWLFVDDRAARCDHGSVPMQGRRR
jgi:hypothetical protein